MTLHHENQIIQTPELNEEQTAQLRKRVAADEDLTSIRLFQAWRRNRRLDLCLLSFFNLSIPLFFPSPIFRRLCLGLFLFLLLPPISSGLFC